MGGEARPGDSLRLELACALADVGSVAERVGGEARLDAAGIVDAGGLATNDGAIGGGDATAAAMLAQVEPR